MGPSPLVKTGGLNFLEKRRAEMKRKCRECGRMVEFPGDGKYRCKCGVILEIRGGEVYRYWYNTPPKPREE